MLQTAITWVQESYIAFILAIVIFIVGRLIARLFASALKRILIKSKVDAILVDFLTAIVRTVLILFVIVAALTQLGVETTSLVALIGAAGLAVGLALKDSLQNFASGVMLILFRPFANGDFIEAGGVSGSVEKIDIFSTTLKTPDNKKVIVPNGSIYGGTITNYSAQPTRRVDMVFGIGYGDDIKKAKDILHKVITDDKRVLSTPATTIAVSELADSSVNFVVRPWVNSSDYWGVFFDAHENVKLAFDEAGISIPFPQMDVHLNK
ncbi:MAG: mechanosensitive ion channel domain-containing protein [Pseudomonadota bacterium]